ncbi:response regulator transcription factor [Paenibacillus cymbidii]|uniref:response regulator transcription factor n=1 Tax=Paenibacillus cymbidii TaxID=1639034 RepID=UPI001081C2F1|nr:response regulator [Paenibacillus cymbidii]
MHRLLIVDDLPLIADGLVELFASRTEWELEVRAVYTAADALRLMEQVKFNLVLTDIRMPEKDGLELLDDIRRLYPSCKVIFLTSYADFAYARRVLSGGGFEYILKTESDDTILRAVGKAIAELEQEYELKRKAVASEVRLMRMAPMLLQQYFVELLQHNRTVTDEEIGAKLREWDVRLRADAPLRVMIGRIDNWPHDDPGDRKLLQFAVGNIAEEHLRPLVELVSFPFEESKLVVLMQERSEERTAFAEAEGRSGEEADARPFAAVLAAAETMQRMCGDLLKLPVSVALSYAAVPWRELPALFHHLHSLLLGVWGAGEAVKLVDRFVAGLAPSQTQTAMSKTYAGNARKLALLRYYLELGERERFERLYRSMMAGSATHNAAGFYKLEMYHALASMFLSYLNLHPRVSTGFVVGELNKLTHVDSDLSWERMTQFFAHMAEVIFAGGGDEQPPSHHDVVRWIDDYIEHNLIRDLSIRTIADLVQLNPSYMSRLYKKTTGIALSEYVQKRRIDKAKELLKHSSHKVYEISEMVGYDSRLSFIRMFKHQTGVTPQEYRDM